MVRDTRSGRHFKDELDSTNFNKTPSKGKDLSPYCLQKSKFLEKGTPPSTAPVKRKSGGLEKHCTPSPMRMSDRTNKNASSSSSGIQQSAKEPVLLGQREKENCEQAMKESKKAKLDVDSHFMNGNKMNARTFKGLFKRQRVMEMVVDVDGALDGPNRSSHVCADDPDRNGVKDSKKSFSVSEKLPGNLLPTSIDAPQPECSASLETTQVVSMNSESGEQFMGPKVVESIPSSSTMCENQGLMRTCVLCSKIKRVNLDSPKQEQCSCTDVVTEDIGCSLSTREERLPPSVSNKSSSEASKFLEYWVPSQISNLQLELYCSTLLSNSIFLRSCSRNDSVGALPDILLNVRKCCDHPYLVDSSLQERMLDEKFPAAEVLDVGIKASGKLQLLDVMLTECMTRGLKTMILHQSIRRTGGASIGDILDDFLRQKYGPNTYERVDARVSLPKRQAAVNRFNKKETGQFAFLLENRACSSTMKLLAVDIVVLYDSDWNPANDIRALQKISFDSKAERMKVFRLYSSCTVEERALVLAKKNLKLDNNLQAFGRTTSDSLLMWGASYLFNQLDDYHAYTNNAAFIISSGHSVLDEVTQEFQAILSESCKNFGLSVISEVRSSAENYSMNIPLLGEAKKQLKDGEEPYIFWKNLLDRKNPPWRHIRASHSRNRKRVQYMNESPGAENDNVAKRHKRVFHENSSPSSDQFELGEHQVTQPTCSDGGGSSTLFSSDKSKTYWTESVTSDSYPNRKYGQSSHGPEVDVGEPGDRGVLYDEQKDLYSFLEGETIKLCQILQLSEVVMDMVRRFLKYVIENHQVSTDSPAYVQALQVSLCWIAASILKQKVDKKDSLMSAKQLLDYQCTEEQVTSVYSRLRTLKRIYLHCSENFVESSNLLVEEGVSMEPSNVDEENAEGQIPIEEKMTMELAESEIERDDRNEVGPSVTSNSAPSEAVCGNAPIETASDLTDSNIPSEKLVLPLDILSLAVVEKPNQSKYPDDEIALMDLPARRQQVSVKSQPFVMNEEVPKVVLDHVPDRLIGCFTPLKLANIPDEELDNIEAVGLADAVENPRNRPDVTTVGALPVPEEQVVHLELISASPNSYDLLLQQVPGKQIPQNLVFAELQRENQSSSHVEVSVSQVVHAVNNSLMSNHGAPETENRKQLHSAFVDVTLSGSQFPTCEVEHQNYARAGSSFPTAEAGEDEVLVHEPSESQENLQLRGNHLDPCPVAGIPELPIPTAETGEDEVLVHEPSSESGESSQLRGNHLDPCPVAVVQELPNHAPRDLHGHSTDQVTTDNSAPELPDEPLQIELERMQKESEKLEKNQKDLISLLNSECEMEIQDMITKIRNNYDRKLKNTEAEYMLKKNELGKNLGLVLMNKMLADAFRSKSLDHRPYGLPGMQQGESESLMQHLQSAPTEHSAIPATTSTPIAILNSMVPPVPRAPALFSNTPSRPPLIGAITPKGNPHSGSENRATAPHLQAIRRPTASSGSLAIPPSTPRPPPPLAQQMQANLASHVRPDPQVVLPTSNVDLSANDMFHIWSLPSSGVCLPDDD